MIYSLKFIINVWIVGGVCKIVIYILDNIVFFFLMKFCEI